jgi:hypothetical protein
VAEPEPPASGDKGGSPFGFLGHKLFGKIPVWVVAVAAVGAYYWYTKYGPGKKTGAQGQTGTDPAGNTGTIDPATGFVYGSPEDLAVLAGSSGTSSAGNYQDWQDQQSGSGTVSPSPTPLTIPMGAGEGPVPGTTGQPPDFRPFQPSGLVIPGVGSAGEGPRPAPRTVPRRGTAVPAPVRTLGARPKAS